MNPVARLLAALCLLTAAASLSAEPPSVSYEWRNVMIGGGGFAPDILFSPAEKHLAYLRTDMGGAYRWDEAQQRWIPLQDGMSEGSYFGIESIAPDPKNPNIVYIAAGMYSRDPAAILRSADRGKTWAITPVPFKMGGNEDGRGLGERLAIDPNRTATLFFGSRHVGLWRSDDSARTWHKVVSFPWEGLGSPSTLSQSTHGGVSFVLFDPNSRTIFAGVAEPTPERLFQSSDRGRTWKAIAGGPAPDLLPVKAALDPYGILYVDYCNGIGPSGITAGAVWKLDTHSGHWTDITPDRTPAATGGYMGLALDRTHRGRVAVSTVDRYGRDTVWLSEDSGGDWVSLRERSRLDVSATPFLRFNKPEPDFGHWMAGLAFDPFDGSTLVFTTGATVMRTDDSAAANPLWMPWVKGDEETAVITLVSPTGGAPLISGFGDIAGFVHERLDVSPPHMHLNPFLPNTNNLDFAGRAPAVAVRSGSIQSRQAEQDVTLAWSADGGENWQPLKVPPISVAGAPPRRYDLKGETPIVVSADGSTFAVSTPIPMFTSDRGRSWYPGAGLPTGARIVADKAAPGTFYAADFQGSRLFVSRNDGHSFAPVEALRLPPFQSAAPRDRESPPNLLAAPGRAGELWFLIGGRLYHSSDAGQSFSIATPADLKIRLFGLGASAPGAGTPALYAFGERDRLSALWRSTDGGVTWARINDDAHQWGLRFRAITGDPRLFGRVYLATDGRGILYGDALPSPP